MCISQAAILDDDETDSQIPLKQLSYSPSGYVKKPLIWTGFFTTI